MTEAMDEGSGIQSFVTTTDTTIILSDEVDIILSEDASAVGSTPGAGGDGLLLTTQASKLLSTSDAYDHTSSFTHHGGFINPAMSETTRFIPTITQEGANNDNNLASTSYTSTEHFTIEATRTTSSPIMATIISIAGENSTNGRNLTTSYVAETSAVAEKSFTKDYATSGFVANTTTTFGNVTTIGAGITSTLSPLLTNEGDDDNVSVLIVGITCAVVGLILGIIIASVAMVYSHKHRNRLKRKPTVAEKNPQEKTFERLDFSLSRNYDDLNTSSSSYKRYEQPFPASECGSVHCDEINYITERPSLHTNTVFRNPYDHDYNPGRRAVSSTYSSSQDDTIGRIFRNKGKRPSSCDTYKTDLPTEDGSTTCGSVFRNDVLPEEDAYSDDNDDKTPQPIKDIGHKNENFNMDNAVIPPPVKFQNKESYANEDEESHSGNSTVSYFDIQISPSAFQSPYHVSAVASGMESPLHVSDDNKSNSKSNIMHL